MSITAYINGTMTAFRLKSGLFAPSELMEIIIRFIVGDTLGLLFGMLVIMLIFRQLRKMAQAQGGNDVKP